MSKWESRALAVGILIISAGVVGITSSLMELSSGMGLIFGVLVGYPIGLLIVPLLRLFD